MNVHQLFDELFQDALSRNRAFQQASSENRPLTPTANAYETENAYEIHLFLPGAKKEGITIEVKDHVLEVQGKQGFPSPENTKTLLEEMRGGEFYRAFRLPEEVAVENIEANYQDGVLCIRIPKKPREVKKIEVKVK
jgi:HSP20 family protein